MFPVPSHSRRPGLDRAALDRLAIGYVGRYATTRAKLRAYLQRKLEQRGWAGDGIPPIDPIVARMAELGYVDDRGFARSRAEGLARRGYGERRVAAALAGAGIEAADARDAIDEVDADALATARAFARRRRLGPYSTRAIEENEDRGADMDRRRKAIAALIRAGHDHRISRRVIEETAGDIDPADETGFP